jgi:hypothetical protein
MMRVVLLGGALLAFVGVSGAGCGGGGSGGAGGNTGTGSTGGSSSDGATFEGGSSTITVEAAANAVTLDACGVTPAVISNVAAGTYTITLSASTLSKGGVSGPTPPPPSFDNYVIVHLPLAAGDPNENHRFFMLNGNGASASITLATAGTIQVMFVDSDNVDNHGTGTVTLSPGGASATVDATANVLAYDTGCHSMPATLTVPSGTFQVKLLDSTLSSGAGAHDDFVLVRTPSEAPMNDDRYVILNGVGASATFTPLNSTTVRVWYIGASAGTGEAHVSVTSQ